MKNAKCKTTVVVKIPVYRANYQIKNLSVSMSLKGTTLLSIPHDRKEKVRGNKTKVRAWGGLGGVARLAGARRGATL